MKHLVRWPLLLLLPARVGCSGTLNYSSEKQKEAQVRQYGQAVLEAYNAQPLAHAASEIVYDVPCEHISPTPAAQKLDECLVKVWKDQVKVELRHQNYSKFVEVGHFDTSALASEGEINAFGRAVAVDYQAWVKTPEAQERVKKQDETQGTPRFGFSAPCEVFTKNPLPSGVYSCAEGPGPADGPTITLRTVDGRSFLFDARKP